MKKVIVIAVIVLFVGVGFQPAFAVEYKELPVKNKLVETSVRIHRANGITPYTLKLTEKESDEVDRIFGNIKVRLDSAETDEEIDEIYDNAVESLYKLGMFPRMTVEETKQLVNGDSKKSQSGNLGTADENFNCSITGQTTETFMFKLDNPSLNILLWYLRSFFFIPGIEHWRYINLLFYIGEIGEISFGRYQKQYIEYYPANGWVSTDGLNGVVE